MPFVARVLQVLIASPGDTRLLRDAVERSVYAWNRARGIATGTLYLPRRWDFDTIPSFGTDVQSVIDERLVDEADLILGIFWHRLGRPTGRAASGSVEEIERCRLLGKSIHVYFGTQPVPHDVDVAELAALRAFMSQLQQEGLVGEFATEHDLVEKVRHALEGTASAVPGFDLPYGHQHRRAQSDAAGVASSNVQHPESAKPSQAATDNGVYRPQWGELRDPVLDVAVHVGDPRLYVSNPSIVRDEIRAAVDLPAVIPSRYHYSSDVLADRWIERCKEPSYRHQRNTVNFWRREKDGGAFAADIQRRLGPRFDYVSLGPGDGQKDAVLVRRWLLAGVDLLYYPYDASYPMVVRAAKRVSTALEAEDAYRVKAVLADFEEIEAVRTVFRHRNAPNIIGLLGNLGNLTSEFSLMSKLRVAMGPDDLLLLEVRLQSSAGLEVLTKGSSLQHDFGPLEEYFGLAFSEEMVTATWSTEKISDVPEVRTMVTTYSGHVPGAEKDTAVLQYIHLYEARAFLDAMEGEGWHVVDKRIEDNAEPPFLECLLRVGR